MRIVAGSHRGRRLQAPPGLTSRPTADRARQALFNILAHSDLVELQGAVVVDAFAGSGALGLEALSQGAAYAIFLDSDTAALDAIRANAESLGEVNRTTILRADAAKPHAAGRACTLALLDPPYHSGLAPACLEGLAAQGWLEDEALAVIEVAVDEDFDPPPAFEEMDRRVYGKAKLVFALYRPPAKVAI